MKTLLLSSALIVAGAAILLFSCVDIPKTGGPVQVVEEPAPDSGSLYAMQTKTLEGEPVDLAQYRGQVALVVNVASECGLTGQYRELQSLYQELAPRGFTVLAFPSNDFWGQEPGSAGEIRSFCTDEYEVTFPLFEKRHVKGDEQDEIYRFLTAQLEEPTWNFTKYLVDRQGQVLARYSPKTDPLDPELRDAIEDAL